MVDVGFDEQRAFLGFRALAGPKASARNRLSTVARHRPNSSSPSTMYWYEPPLDNVGSSNFEDNETAGILPDPHSNDEPQRGHNLFRRHPQARNRLEYSYEMEVETVVLSLCFW